MGRRLKTAAVRGLVLRIVLVFAILLLATVLVACSNDGENNSGAQTEDCLAEVTFDDSTFVYDGNYHFPSFKGLPVGATVTYYDKDNGALEIGYRNAGEYTVYATVTYGEQVKDFAANMVISKASVDESSIHFADKTIIWDGGWHELTLEGELPPEITVTYEGSKQASVGAYEYTVHFDTGNNYEPIASRKATLTILERMLSVVFIYQDEDGAAASKEIEVGYGKAILQEEIPVLEDRAGYNVYWSCTDFEVVTEDMVIVAQYEPIQYSITYNYCDGSIRQDTYTVEDNVELEVPERDYYSFDGWFDNDLFDGEALPKIEKGSIGNIKLYAKWTAIIYRVSYELYGGVNSMHNFNTADKEYEYTVNDSALILRNPTKTGCVFVGWYDDISGEQVEQIGGDDFICRDINLCAGWVLNEDSDEIAEWSAIESIYMNAVRTRVNEAIVAKLRFTYIK